MVVKLDERKKLSGRPRTLPWPNTFVTRMMTRDLFAVANVLVAFHVSIL